jgi:hypothetical protein
MQFKLYTRAHVSVYVVIVVVVVVVIIIIIIIKSRDSSVGVATRLWGWTIGVLGFDSRRGLGIFLFTAPSRTALVPTQPPIQWVPGTLSLRVKRASREADHSLPSSAEVKNAWSYTSTLPIRLHGVVLS